MPLDFDMGNITVTEFGVGREAKDGWAFVVLPVDNGVQDALHEIVRATWSAMKGDDDPAPYQPSEKHGSTEYLSIERGNDWEAMCRQLHDAENLLPDAATLKKPNEILCYFARLVDAQGKRLTALRRAVQFKGVLKSRLVQIVTDSLKIVEEKIFKLDNDFDVLIDSQCTHIWRPSAFEFLGGLKQAVLKAVPANVEAIQKDVPFMDFKGIRAYASTHSRAARYLASIRTQKLAGIERNALVALCKKTGVELEEADGALKVGDRHIMGFLEVLDRRRYEVGLVPGTQERFRATSRRQIQGN